MADLVPHFDDVQSHYDLSDDFYRLFLDDTHTYSCAYFERDDMTLEEAQFAKMDLSLGKLGLEPGMTLLDIGCGWGATMMRAVERYDVNVVGLTLSENQHAHVEKLFADSKSPRSMRVLLNGWEQFDEPVDRIVSIGAFEHFGFDRYDDFFAMAYRVLPDDGVMLLHTICGMSMEYARANDVPLTMELFRFVKFIMKEIFPGGQLCKAEMIGPMGEKAGFTLTRTQELRPHYARTLSLWADALSARRDDAVALQGQEVYDRYMHYLTGCSKLFAQRQAFVNQFTFTKSPTKLE
ncbi:MAG: SAM-dependent methyltransferase [Mycobacterium sp.]|jgi:cyclopropane-fatty-acyl-phospholipid synthase|nr:SAM-dependent methyltransferase [Mycobacterium sp.]MDT5316883.1 cyclopropane-fatty-acyl-phospholipid synthase [Mycobacterium sp.]